MVRYRAAVIAGWLVVVVLGLASATGLNNLLSTSLAVPGTDSARADQILSAHFGQNVEGTFTVVLSFKSATAAQLDGLESKISAAAHAVPSGHVIEKMHVSPDQFHLSMIVRDQDAEIGLCHFQARCPQLCSLSHSIHSHYIVGRFSSRPPHLEISLFTEGFIYGVPEIDIKWHHGKDIFPADLTNLVVNNDSLFFASDTAGWRFRNAEMHMCSSVKVSVFARFS